MQNAIKDIDLGIRSQIVYKYIIDNAPDCIALKHLYFASKSCYIFGVLHLISHTMINPKVIIELINMMNNNQNITDIIEHINNKKTRDLWNTEEFHQEMTAVTSNYNIYGGFELNNTNNGVAHFVFQDINKIYSTAKIIELWLEEEIANEDELIIDVFNQNILGMNITIDDYWLLHFCRGISLIRQKCSNKKTIQSKLFLNMVGVKKFIERYENIGINELDTIYSYCKKLIEEIDSNIIFTYGDFGCLCCETYRMIDEFEKNNVFDFRDKVQDIINDKIKLDDWIKFKKDFIVKNNLPPAIENSARNNVEIYLRFVNFI
jgi:hypothetical protein